MQALTIAIALSLLLGCASPVGQAIDSQKVYRMTLEMEINGIKSVGVAVVPQAASYLIKAKAPEDPQVVTISTCHREITLQKQDDRFQYTYVPTALEAGKYCPMHISALSAKAWYTGGFIDVVDGAVSVPATVICNGVTTTFRGASVCQSRAGLQQRIVFPSVMEVGHSARCPDPETKDGLTWDYRASPGECAHKFWLKTDPRVLHRLSVIGYEEYILQR